MELIKRALFLVTIICLLSCESDKIDDLNIECPCIFKDEQPPLYKSCQQLGENKERWECVKISLMQKIYANLEYPKSARDNNKEGLVVIAIIVSSEGKVLKTEVRNEILLGYGLEEAAIKAIELVRDNWCPGLINCESVETEFVMPLHFKLAG